MKKILIIGSLAALTLTAVGLVATASLGAKEVTPVHLTIRASEMQYEPKELHLKAGVPVHLTLVNDGKVLHDFNLQGIKDSGKPAHNHQVGHNHASGHNHAMAGSDSHIAVEPGKSAGLHFTPSAGEFAFYCSVPGHREAGMSGKILAH
ncbi:MAG TPA: plastocyanin/azurin family copper-binding protein [Turneriella sp.]|nr:plastocyanin/azurin family copper-binding protein [Turneriella sp.]HNM27478.1 plastocyanin/azurin family copper-binding protein [Saprospiraceae bacterium]